MKPDKCIRVLADQTQIEQCRNEICDVDPSISQIANVLSLAGNEVRLKILYLLHKEGELCPCDLSDILNMSIPAVSQHLRKMKDAGLIIYKKTGQTVFYRLNEKHEEILQSIYKLIKSEKEPIKS